MSYGRPDRPVSLVDASKDAGGWTPAAVVLRAIVTGPLDDAGLRRAVATASLHHRLDNHVELAWQGHADHGRREILLRADARALDGLGASRLFRDALRIYDGRHPEPSVTREHITDVVAGIGEQDRRLADGFWFAVAEHRPRPDGLVRALRLVPPTGRIRDLVVSDDPAVVAGFANGDAPTSTELYATVLDAFREVLSGHASDGDVIDVWRQGLAGGLPGAVGRFGRYIAMPVDDLTSAWSRARTERWLVDSDTLADLAPASHRAVAAVAAFSSQTLPARTILAAGPTVDVVDLTAPIDGHQVECVLLHASEGPRLLLRCDEAVDDLAADGLAHDLLRRLRRRSPSAATRSLRGRPAAVTDELSDRIAVHATRTPDAVAIVDGEQAVTYAGLRADVEASAEGLGAAGVTAGDLVAIDLPRGAELVRTALAALAIGAAFVLLNRSDPAARRRRVIADAQPRLIVGEVASTDATGRIAVTRPPAAGRQLLAYLSYTSGSSGRPKGVQVARRGLANYLSWATGRYAGGTGSLLHTDVAADLTLTSWMVPLWAGEPVKVVASDEPGAFAEALLTSRDLSFVKLTPSGLLLLDAVLDADGALDGTVRHVVLGGEQMDARHLLVLERLGLGGRLVTNEYGPTETVVGSTAHTFAIGSDQPSPVPVGTPIANTVVAVRDRYGLLCPAGIAGEIAIAGSGVADGYRGLPDDTARRFVTGQDGAREFRTGDIGWIDQHRRLRYVGRADRQIKLHGYRVELDEVESILHAHPAVRRAAATVVGQPHRLHVTLELVDGWPQRKALPALRRHAAEQLAPHARPDHYRFVDALLMTPAGKVDYRSLSSPPPGKPTAAQPSSESEPATDAAVALAGAWRRVLGAAPADDDSFFGAGGDSISALRLVGELRQAGWTIGMRDVLAQRTFTSIAAHLRQEEIAVIAVDAPGPVALHANQRDALAGGPAELNGGWACVATVEGSAPLDVDRLRAAARRTLARHGALRLAVDADQRAATIRPADAVELPVVELAAQTTLRDARTQVRGRLDPAAGIHLALGVLPSGTATVLVAAAAHLVADPLSLGRILDTLHESYHVPDRPATGDGYRGIVASASPDRRPFAATAGRPRPTVALNGATRPAEPDESRRLADAVRVAAVAAVAGEEFAGVVLEGHGRDAAGGDVVGWLASYEPASPADAQSAEGRLVAVNFLGEHHRIATRWGDAQIAWPEPGADTPPLFALQLTCWTSDGQLHQSWAWDPESCDRVAAERVAARFDSCLTDALDRPQITDSTLAAADLSRILRDFG